MSPSPSKKKDTKKVKKLLKRLEKNDRLLNECHLTGENLDDDVITNISLALAKNTNVKSLTLTKCNIGSCGIIAIAKSLSMNTSIEEVSLSYNKSIGDEGIEKLASMTLECNSNSTITDLHLRSCNIGPAGALSLCHALQTNYTLTDIDLGENDLIPEHTLTSIQRHLKNNSNPSKKTKKNQLSNDIHHQSNLSSSSSNNTLDYHYHSSNNNKQVPTTFDLEQTSDETTPTTNDNGKRCCCTVQDLSIPSDLELRHTDNDNNRLLVHLDQCLGTGHFSQVYAATYSVPKRNNDEDEDEDETVNLACKFMKLKVKGLDSWDIYNIYNELDILRSICLHENIVSIIGVSFAVNDILTNATTEISSNQPQMPSSNDIKPLCILMEQATIGSLHTYLAKADKSIDHTIAQSILYDISKGMFALHAHHPQTIFHQNLKSSNILLFHSDQTQCGILAKISDFGLPFALSHDCTPISVQNQSTSTTSSIHWRAPETFGKKCQYSEASDVWSFGMIMYEIATREIPFAGNTPSEVMYALCVEQKVPDITVPTFSFTDEFSVNLIESCWNWNPKDRPRFGAIMRSLCQILKRSEGSFVCNGVNSVKDRITIMTSMEQKMQRFNQYLLKCKEKQQDEWDKLNDVSMEELLEIAKFFSMMYSDVPLQPDHFPFFEDVLSIAEICQVQFHTTLQSLVEESNGKYCRKPMKDKLFLDIEFRNMHNFDPRNVIDIVQGSGSFTSPSDLIHFLETLTTAPKVSIIQLIDNMNHPHPDGYRNLVLYVAILGRSGPKFVGEFSLHLSVLQDLQDLLLKSETNLDDSQSWRLCTDSSFQ